MRVSTLVAAASLVVFSHAQDFTIQPFTSTDDLPRTLAPEECAGALESCNEFISTIAPVEVYTVLTLDEEDVPATLTNDIIPTNDPLLTQSDRLIIDGVTPTPFTTAEVSVSWYETSSTTCDPYITTTSYIGLLPDNCVAASTFGTPQGPSVKTRVVLKPREDIQKDPNTDPGDNRNGGPTTEPTPPGGEPTTTPPTDGPTESSPSEVTPTPGPSETGSETTTGTDTTTTTAGSAETSASETSSSDYYTSTDSNVYTTDTTSESTTLTSSRRTSPTSSTGSDDDDDREEVETSFTTIASVSDGVTRFHTKPIATITRSSDDVSTTEQPGAGAQVTIMPGVLAIALGLGAILGL